ncbi:hypothetical protein N7U66_02015 [Lacinutrix neustonica]|uniref:Uncharacterized protein n=1 Tax=Lacinutrix neustonica TaxID=2980107 RepID=A0A9E8MVR6_9FLAO|nr:hypothetical protein [Lacinutrix neustonica]WAC02512.1 hypothetical protein N7U66_02015 [Lacinutrix neustonica]
MNEINVEKIILKFQYIIWLQIAKKNLEPHIINAYLSQGEKGVLSLINSVGIDFDVLLDNDEIKTLI